MDEGLKKKFVNAIIGYRYSEVKSLIEELEEESKESNDFDRWGDNGIELVGLAKEWGHDDIVALLVRSGAATDSSGEKIEEVN